jgi:hypothetical protein
VTDLTGMQQGSDGVGFDTVETPGITDRKEIYSTRTPYPNLLQHFTAHTVNFQGLEEHREGRAMGPRWGIDAALSRYGPSARFVASRSMRRKAKPHDGAPQWPMIHLHESEIAPVEIHVLRR